jgi:hypothetical protein
MQIQNLEYLEEAPQPILGGFVVNKITIVALAQSLASATALAYYGDASARAKAKNEIEISLGRLPF